MDTGRNDNGGSSTGYQLPAVAWMMDDQDGEAEPQPQPQPQPYEQSQPYEQPAAMQPAGPEQQPETPQVQPAAAHQPPPVHAHQPAPAPSAPVPSASVPSAQGPSPLGPVRRTAAQAAPTPPATDPSAQAHTHTQPQTPAAQTQRPADRPAPLAALRRAVADPAAHRPAGPAPTPTPAPAPTPPDSPLPAPAASATPGAPVPVEPGQGSGEPSGPGRVVRLHRLKRPAVAAAATVGMVLMGLPLVISHGNGSAQSLGDTDSAGLSRTDAPVGGDSSPHTPAPGDVTAPPSAAPGSPGATPDPAADPAAATAPGSVPGQPPAAGTGVAPDTAAGPAAGGAGVVPVTAPGAGPVTAPGRTGTPAAPTTPVAVPPVQPTPKPTTPPAAAPSYTGIGGAWCKSASVSFSQYGWWEGDHGWFTQTGGFAGASCDGKFTSMPMSGSATKDDGNSVVWTFRTAPVTSGTCRISVYVPNNKDIRVVGGAPAYYTVQNGSSPGSGTIGSFSVNQVKNLGQWVNAGSFKLTGGSISVMLHTRGVDFDSANHAHLAAASARADCS
ncbi:hypothetical protein [Kitasatospora sp. NPDC094015]|uniref:hypothetical protein n=1 Tax=Kitasatospora sp. NPDC094015 TaxID=3155205 RepID=UPI0033186E34